MITQTKETQEKITAADARRMLEEGNKRFIESKMVDRDLMSQVATTSGGQAPFGVVLSCIDSRVPAETVFDQGIGDIFSARIAGNIVNEDILGSMEFACKLAGSKIVVVMGHTRCGAVNGACQHVEMGNLTVLLDKIQPAVQKVNPNGGEMDRDAIEQVGVENVKLTLDEIRQKSQVLADLEKEGTIQIVGAMYNVHTGAVEFL
jgi:carbonic anhydrase